MIEILIVPVKVEQKDILKNLIEKYEYEFSQYNKLYINTIYWKKLSYIIYLLN